VPILFKEPKLEPIKVKVLSFCLISIQIRASAYLPIEFMISVKTPTCQVAGVGWLSLAGPGVGTGAARSVDSVPRSRGSQRR